MPRTVSFNLLAFATMFYLSILVVGCSSTPSAALLEAERMMEQCPDSASAVIESINPDSLGRSADKALYNLLITQSLYKNYLPLPADSVIQFAVDYYKGSGDDARLMRALYYKGVVDREHGDYESAIPSALHAEELARRLDSPLWIARTNELLSDIFYDNYNWEESMKHTEVAEIYYQDAGKDLNACYVKVHKALLYTQMKEYDKSLNLIDNILDENEKAVTDSALVAYCVKISISTLLYKGDFSSAKKYISMYNNLMGYYYPTANDYTNFAEIYIAQGDTLSASEMLQMASGLTIGDNESYFLRLAKSHYAVLKGDYKGAYDIMHGVLECEVDRMNRIQSESPLNIERNYYDNKANVIKQKVYWFKLVITLVSIAFVFCMVVGIVIYRLRMKVKNLEITKSMDEIKMLNDKVRLYTELQRNQNEKKLFNHLLYQDRFRTVSLLGDEYFDSREISHQLKPIHRHAKKEIAYLREPSTLQTIEVLVNENMNNIMQRLRAEVPGLTDANYQLALFVYGGLSLRTICLLIDSTLHNLSNKVGRLRNKILASNAEDKEWFAENLKVKKYSLNNYKE